MVFALTAAMLVGTPLTASAAPLNSVYSVQKPGMDIDEDKEINTSGTGTVTNTETGSGILVDNEAKIQGLVLDRETVNAEAGVNEKLTATLITSGDLTGTVEDEEGNLKQLTHEEALAKLSQKITWRLGRLDKNGKFVQDTGLSKVLGIKIDTGADNKNVDRRELTLIPKQGTVAGEEVYVHASINSSVYIDKDGKVKEYADNLSTYEALAKVSIKQYTTELEWKWEKNANVKEPIPYVNHTIDLSKYLVRTPETANDTITWTSSDTKVAPVTAAGVVTIKKADKDFTIYATSEEGVRKSWDKKTKAGTPATAIEIWSVGNEAAKLGNQNVDVGNLEEGVSEKTIKVQAKLFVTKKVVVKADGTPATTVEEAEGSKTGSKYKVKNVKLTESDDPQYYIEANKNATELVIPEGSESPVQTLEITDNVVWSSNKTGIANVTVNAENDRLATITIDKDAQIGNAVITAKTPKKAAKLTVKVTATLEKLEITNTEKELYSGQTLQMTYQRTPAGNKDSVKWSLKKVNNKKDPNASINKNGLLTIKPTIKATESDGITAKVTVVLTSPKKGTRGLKEVEYPITLKQSSIDGITIQEVHPVNQPVAKVGVKSNGKVGQLQSAGTTTLDIPVNGRYTIDVDLGKNANADFTKEIALKTLTYKNSNTKAVDISYKDGKATIIPKATGKAKITFSGVRATANNNSVVSGKAISTSFNVTVRQPVTTVTLSKPEIVLAEKLKSDKTAQDLKISGLKVTFGPKKANIAAQKKIDRWEIKKQGDPEWTTITKNATTKNTATTLSYTLKQPKANEVYEIKVTTTGGVTATSKVRIVSAASAVAIASEKLPTEGDITPTLYNSGPKKKDNTASVEVGKSISLYPCVNIGTKSAPNWKSAGATSLETDDENYLADSVVSYTVNRKGYVNVDLKNGKVYGVKNGTVKITFKTATGKTAKLDVTVTLPKKEQ